MVLRKEDVLKKPPQQEPYYKDVGEFINKGNSLIVDPNDEILTGPLHTKKAYLLPLHMLRGSKWNQDTAGHYARPYTFELTGRKRPAPIIREEKYSEEHSMKS